MKVLVPVDGSACGYRALEFAAEFVQRYNGTIHVIHITSEMNKFTEEIFQRADEILADAGVSSNPEIVTDLDWTDPRYGNQIGKDILSLVEEREYDHVIMGHNGSGAVGRLVLGSAAETVVRAADTPATIIP